MLIDEKHFYSHTHTHTNRRSDSPTQEQEELSVFASQASLHTAGGWTPGTPEAHVKNSSAKQPVKQSAHEAICTSGMAFSSLLHLCFSLS